MEAGAGTGSLSYSILKAIGKEGKLVTLDLNEKTIGIARTQKDVARVSGVTEVTIRNRYKEISKKLGLDDLE